MGFDLNLTLNPLDSNPSFVPTGDLVVYTGVVVV